MDGVELQSAVEPTFFAVPSCQCVELYSLRWRNPLRGVKSDVGLLDIRCRSVLKDIRRRGRRRVERVVESADRVSLVAGASSPLCSLHAGNSYIIIAIRALFRVRCTPVLFIVFVTDDWTVLFLYYSSFLQLFEDCIQYNL